MSPAEDWRSVVVQVPHLLTAASTFVDRNEPANERGQLQALVKGAISELGLGDDLGLGKDRQTWTPVNLSELPDWSFSGVLLFPGLINDYHPPVLLRLR